MGMRVEKLNGLYELKRKAQDYPYLLIQRCIIDENYPETAAQRENWETCIVVLNEEMVPSQFLRRLLAKRVSNEKLWDWAVHPRQKLVSKLINDFKYWLRSQKDRYSLSRDGDGVPRL